MGVVRAERSVGVAAVSLRVLAAALVTGLPCVVSSMARVSFGIQAPR